MKTYIKERRISALNMLYGCWLENLNRFLRSLPSSFSSTD